MSYSTPDLLTLETLDEVAIRLTAFTKSLIDHLRAIALKVETGNVFLLNSTAHPIEVPVRVEDVTVQMEFSASVKHWMDRPKASLSLSFNNGTTKIFHERAQDQSFKLVRVLEAFIRALEGVNDNLQKERHFRSKRLKSEANFEALAKSLNFAIVRGREYTAGRANVKLKSIPTSPQKVTLALVVSHEQAEEVIRNYLAEPDRQALPSKHDLPNTSDR